MSFFMVWRVKAYGCRIVADCPLCFWYFSFRLYSFDFLFRSYFLYKDFICFQFKSLIIIFYMFFHFSPYSFKF
jgi:hypothetical protein